MITNSDAPPLSLVDSQVRRSCGCGGSAGFDTNKIQVSASAGISPITRKGYEVSVSTDRCSRLGIVSTVDDDTPVMRDPAHSTRSISGDENDLIVKRVHHGSSIDVKSAAHHPSIVTAGHGKMIVLGVVGP